MARYIQISCVSTLNLINQRNVSHIKLSKYCDIDARLLIMHTWRTLQAIYAAHTLKFAVGLHGTQKFHLIVKYKHHQISSAAQTSLQNQNIRLQLTLVLYDIYDFMIDSLMPKNAIYWTLSCMFCNRTNLH